MKIRIRAYALTMSELRELSGGELILHGLPEAPEFSCICTDSREADGETLFCALRGDRADGHDYMIRAAAAGCRCFLCERLPEAMRAPDAPPYAALVVPDVIAALAPPAYAHMKRRDPAAVALTHCVAITGSVGKTTAKECVSAILAPAFRLFKKDGNYNSTIGMPLSVMELTPDYDAAVLEMGMSGRGEIALMSDIARPDVAVITNIGSSHLEKLGTRENIARAKLEIAGGLREGGTLLVNGNEPLLRELIPALVRPDVRVGRVSMTDPTADYYAGNVTVRDGGMCFDLTLPDGRVWRGLVMPAWGEHLVLTAAFGAAVGVTCGLDEAQVRAGLLAFRPAAMRQNILRAGDVTLIEDCYNAAPESMRAGLNVLGLAAGQGRRLAVLGDMKELGNDTVSLHRAVGADCVRAGLDGLVTVGALGAELARGAVGAGMDPADVIILNADPSASALTPAEIASRTASLLRPGDTLLIKASRSMELERVADALKALLDGAR